MVSEHGNNQRVMGGEVIHPPHPNDLEHRLLFKWATLFSLALPLPSAGSCIWYAANPGVDASPADLIPGPTFDEAATVAAGYGTPTVVWGDLAAYFYQDGSAGYALISRDFTGLWTWGIGVVGNPTFANGIPTSLQASLNSLLANAPPYLPGICAS